MTLVVRVLVLSLAALSSAAAVAADPATKTLLLLGQRPDGHPPGTH